jgi:hypothetical protein
VRGNGVTIEMISPIFLAGHAEIALTSPVGTMRTAVAWIFLIATADDAHFCPPRCASLHIA